MRSHGATRIYAKALSANDNSKNQIYLGGDFSALQIIPHGNVFTDKSGTAGAVRDRARACIDFYWIDINGKYRAPNTSLILYPRYPEVRMSGFLSQCSNPPTDVMRVRDVGRVLVVGVTPQGSVLGYAAAPHEPVAAETLARSWPKLGVFLKLPDTAHSESPRIRLLSELRRIHHLHWIRSQKLAPDGTRTPYSARNGGGYTLEAELGIAPNGYAEPDFMGWEIKQYGVTDFEFYRPKSPVTLMTPEPTGGIYRSEGVGAFIAQYGYPDQSGIADRFNFGGRYDLSRTAHHLTGLRISVRGFDAGTGKITDIDGDICLVDSADVIAASWSFKGLMAHWNRKHALAAYVPSLFRHPPPEYCYGARVLLCEQTDFLLFLKAFSAGAVYYDPGIKVECASGIRPEIKRRSQFRIAHADLKKLYVSHEFVAL